MIVKKVFSKRGFNTIYHCIMYIIIYFINKLLINKKHNKDIWIICERSDEARDNGYHMFKYIREKHPEIKIYYVIKKNCDDRKKVEKIGNIINFGSVKHIFLYFFSNKHISTHINGCFPNERAYLLLQNIFKVNAKKVFLQHGITKDYLKAATANFVKLDLFVCGALPEYNYVIKTFGHPNSVVKYLGLARFDTLHEKKTNNQILLMPTFRMDLFIYADDKLDRKKEERFSKSAYYKAYNSLINNKQLEEILERNNLELIFYPHYEIQRYLHLFKTTNNRVKIADRSKYDVQSLLKGSKLLITDYSSVFFDFAYMKKPVIYYHFDYDEYRKSHYKEGYFSYVKDGFGPVVKNEEELLNSLISSESLGFKMSDYYLDRLRKFFTLYDENNRERNYKAILDLK